MPKALVLVLQCTGRALKKRYNNFSGDIVYTMPVGHCILMLR